jgi:hypothetical protein
MQVQEEAVPAWDANHQIKHRLSKKSTSSRRIQKTLNKKRESPKNTQKNNKTNPSHSQNQPPISGTHPLAMAAPEHQGPRARNGSGAPDPLAAAAARAPGNLQEGKITCGTTDV